MEGGLADWLEVGELFRRGPIPVISTHTEDGTRKKDRNADNLAIFVQEKFLDVSSIVGLIRKHDPARRITEWLTAPANTDLLGGNLDLSDDVRLQAFI